MKPWETEPDSLSFKEYGYECLIIRQQSLKTLCGYVGVPDTHPLYGEAEVDCNVHGGITFTGDITAQSNKNEILWWVGFDCAHGGDLVPAMETIDIGIITQLDYVIEDVYRDIEYVKDECKKLAEALQMLEIDSIKLIASNKNAIESKGP